MTTADVTLDVLLAHRSLVRRIATDLLVDPDAAEDVVQQTWLAALRHTARGGEVRVSLLSRIAQRLASNRRREDRRRSARESAAPSSAALPDPAAIAATEELRGRVLGAVLRLEERLRTVVLLRYLSEQPESEIADRLQVPVETVRSRLKKARSILRERLKSDDPAHSARGLLALAGGGPEIEALVAKGLTVGTKAWLGVAIAVVVGVAYVGRGLVQSPAQDATDPMAAQSSREGVPKSEFDSEAVPTSVSRGAVTPTSDAVDRSADSAMVEITGTCVSPSGAPIARVTVRSPDAAGSATSGDDGRFALALTGPWPVGEPRTFVVTARAPGRADASKRVRCAGGERRELGSLVLGPGGAIRGVVLDESGRPTPAKVVLHPGLLTDDAWAVGLDDAAARIATNAGGEFVLEGLAEGWYALVAEHRELRVERPIPIGVTAGAEAEVRIEMRRLRDDERIVGRVVDELDRPLADVPVRWTRLIQSKAGGFRMGTHVVRSEADGSFSCPADATSETNFLATFEDGRTASIARIRGGSHDVVLRRPATTTFDVTIVDAGSGLPFPGATVIATWDDGSPEVLGLRQSSRRWTATSGADGIARVPLPPREFGLRIEAEDRSAVEVGPFAAGRPPTLGPIVLEPLPAVRVVVEAPTAARQPVRVSLRRADPKGAPTTWARLAVRATTVEHEVVVEPDVEFRVPIGRLGDGADWFLKATCPEHAAEWKPLTQAAIGDEQPIRLKLTRGGAIAGRVLVDGDGSPAGLAVLATDGLGERRSTRVEQDGTYRLSAVRAGVWSVDVGVEDDVPERPTPNDLEQAARVEVDEGETSVLDLRHEVPPRVVVEGRVRLGDASSYGIGVVLVTIDERSSARGIDPIGAVARATITPAGAYRIEHGATGTYALKVSRATDSGSTTVLRPCTLGVGTNVLDVQEPCGILEGVRRGAPMNAVQARGERADGTVVLVNARCDPVTGAFSMPLVPAGSYVLHAGDRTDPVEVGIGQLVTAPEP